VVVVLWVFLRLDGCSKLGGQEQEQKFYCKSNSGGPSIFTGGSVILQRVWGSFAAVPPVPITTAPVALLVCRSIPFPSPSPAAVINYLLRFPDLVLQFLNLGGDVSTCENFLDSADFLILSL